MKQNLIGKIGTGILVASALVSSGCNAPGKYGLDNANTRRFGTAIVRSIDDNGYLPGEKNYLNAEVVAKGE